MHEKKKNADEQKGENHIWFGEKWKNWPNVNWELASMNFTFYLHLTLFCFYFPFESRTLHVSTLSIRVRSPCCRRHSFHSNLCRISNFHKIIIHVAVFHGYTCMHDRFVQLNSLDSSVGGYFAYCFPHKWYSYEEKKKNNNEKEPPIPQCAENRLTTQSRK